LASARMRLPRRSGGMADATVSNTVEGNLVRVRPPASAPPLATRMAPALSLEAFDADVELRPNGAIAIRLPFEPAAAWRERDAYHVAGSIDGYPLRGKLNATGDAFYLQLGPAWNRARRFVGGETVSVRLEPEGPQLETVAADIAEALAPEPVAQRFFESLATFYRKGFIRWIESAGRPSTRAKRIEEAVAALKAGKSER
jgi:hypothetical protein